MTDKLNLQQLDNDPRLPMRGSIDFERVLYVRLYELFRAIAGVTNQNGQAISDAISNVTTQLTEDINQAIAGVTNQNGSNSNGNFVKFPDGTMICYGQYIHSGNGWQPETPVINFPASFIETPIVTATNMTDNTAWYPIPLLSKGSVTRTGFKLRTTSLVTTTFTSIDCHWQAIGRWK
ncbi:hypothetical protein HMPREF3144_06470 [Oligella sp. HMSC05A10]|uniref:hypothetical protein n=1 Tax=Oligella sp. HMSC05A10 TaxID=1581112 RepID=UPI0008A57175|nr:hypothetical protein [Oligella sp. HMSC05A10]OFS84485.1 hypothetical protein HMPREF3144_06470 [Oligella sp. HMSC05A10]